MHWLQSISRAGAASTQCLFKALDPVHRRLSELLQHDDLLRSIVSKIPAVGGIREVEQVQEAGRKKKGLDVDMKWRAVRFSDLDLTKMIGHGSFGRVSAAACGAAVS